MAASKGRPEISEILQEVIEVVNAGVIATRQCEEAIRGKNTRIIQNNIHTKKNRKDPKKNKPLPPAEPPPAKPIGWDSIVQACQDGIPVDGSLSLIRPAEAVKIGANLFALTGEKFPDPDPDTGLQPHCQTAHSHGLAILPFMHAASELVNGRSHAEVLASLAKAILIPTAPTANFAHVTALITRNHEGINQAGLNLLKRHYVDMQTKAVRHLIV